jgi:hypothetical protein
VPGVGLWAGIGLSVARDGAWVAYPALATGFVGYLDWRWDEPLGNGKERDAAMAKRAALAYAKDGHTGMRLVAFEASRFC